MTIVFLWVFRAAKPHLTKWWLWTIKFLADKTDKKEKDQIWQMIGEFFRELGVLIIVFYPVERRFADQPHGPALVVAGGLLCLVVGIVIERKR